MAVVTAAFAGGSPVGLSSRLLHAAAPVRCTNCGPHWLDYAAGLGSIASVAIAVVAVVLAVRSATDARRSGDAASLLAAELTRRATLSPSIDFMHMGPETDGRLAAVVRSQVSNTGDRTARAVTLLLLAPRTVELVSFQPDASARPAVHLVLQEVQITRGSNAPLPSHASRTVPIDIPPNVYEEIFTKAIFPGPSIYALQTEIIHDSLPNGRISTATSIVVT